MFPDLSPRSKAATFAVLVMLACSALMFALRSAGDAAGAIVMFTPAAAVLVMMLVVTRDGWHRAGWRALGLRPAGLRYWPFAVLVPFLVLVAAEAVTVLTGLARVDFSQDPDLVTFALRTVANLVLVGGFAFFEEIGWRGYLLPIVQRDGRPFAAARVGFLQGLWHLPLVFLVAGAYLTEGDRWLTVPVFLGVLTAAGVVYGWLRDRSGSVWPAVVVHSAFNVTLGILGDTMITKDPAAVALVSRETGVATLGVLVLVAVVLTARTAVSGVAARPAVQLR